jgi:K+-transporting ATPase ATPase C chain
MVTSVLREFRPAIIMVIALSSILGLAYPLAVTGVAQLAFPGKADGSLITDSSGNTVGSKLIAQSFRSTSGSGLQPQAPTATTRRRPAAPTSARRARSCAMRSLSAPPISARPTSSARTATSRRSWSQHPPAAWIRTSHPTAPHSRPSALRTHATPRLRTSRN